MALLRRRTRSDGLPGSLDRSRWRSADHRSGGAAGQGKTTTTGKLGDVMNESIAAALSVVRHPLNNSVSRRTSTEADLHIHLPEGAAQGRAERRHRHLRRSCRY